MYVGTSLLMIGLTESPTYYAMFVISPLCLWYMIASSPLTSLVGVEGILIKKSSSYS